MERSILGSRALLFPGPQPPLSHLGVTLLRHVVGSGARYACYQLGLPLPEAPPVRIARLRLYLDAGSLRRALSASAAGDEVVAALLDPGGAAVAALPPATRAAAAFHRLRLLLGLAGSRQSTRGEAATPWRAFRHELSARLPGLNEAFLGELVAALDRRGRRRRGRLVPPAIGPAAHAWLGGHPRRPERLGAPDLLVDSWSGRSPSRPPEGAETIGAHPLRGRFRERYRVALNELRPLYLDLAVGAASAGVLDRPEDAFFIPFDLAADLELDRRPAWLPGAVAANRAEYENQLAAPPPPEVLTAGWERTVAPPGTPDWELAPLTPLD